MSILVHFGCFELFNSIIRNYRKQLNVMVKHRKSSPVPIVDAWGPTSSMLIIGAQVKLVSY